MNILFLHANQPDYLAESLFHGLRQLLGENCVDFPRDDSTYAPLKTGIKSKLRGYGFTLYGFLDEIESLKEERFFWKSEFILPKYDLVIIADILSATLRNGCSGMCIVFSRFRFKARNLRSSWFESK